MILRLYTLTVERLSICLLAVWFVSFLLTAVSYASIAPNQEGATSSIQIAQQIQILEQNKTYNAARILTLMRKGKRGNDSRYFYSDQHGWIDSRHFFMTARLSLVIGQYEAIAFGFMIECWQWIRGEPSGFSYEDLSSNAAGAEFGDWIRNSPQDDVASIFQLWCAKHGTRLPDDPAANLASLPVSQ